MYFAVDIDVVVACSLTKSEWGYYRKPVVAGLLWECLSLSDDPKLTGNRKVILNGKNQFFTSMLSCRPVINFIGVGFEKDVSQQLSGNLCEFVSV